MISGFFNVEKVTALKMRPARALLKERPQNCYQVYKDNINVYRTVNFLTLENPLITQRKSKLYYALEKRSFYNNLILAFELQDFPAYIKYKRTPCRFT